MARNEVAAVLDNGSCNEMIAQVIAGPETAARLGVPVGTVVEARHAITPTDGSPSPLTLAETVISPQAAELALARFHNE